MEVLNHTTYFLTGIIFTLGFIIYLFFKERFRYWQKKNVPSIQPTIPFGNALDVVLGRITFGELFSKAYLEFKKQGHKHGGIYYFWQPIYVPVDDDLIKKILISDFEYFPSHGFYMDPESDPLTTHIFSLSGYRWKTIRSKIPTAFTGAKMRVMFPLFTKINNVFVNDLEKYALSETEVDIKKHLIKLTIDTISACIFGVETNTIQNQNGELVKHGKSFFDHQFNLFRNSLTILLPQNILKACGFKVFTKETDEYILSLFRTIKEKRESSNEIRNDLVNIFIQMMGSLQNKKYSLDQEPIDPVSLEEFIANMYFFFSAGFETSSSATTFALYELAKNGDCQQQLRDEIETVLGRDAEPTYDAVAEMSYLDHIVEETLRLYPSFPVLPRLSSKPYQVPGTDIVLDKYTFAVITNLGIQRNPEHYPEPERFNPDRFQKENKSQRPFVSHIPFGEGPRICLGKRFGILQLKVSLINVIRNFRVTLGKKTTNDFKFVSTELILRKSGDVWIKLEKI